MDKPDKLYKYCDQNGLNILKTNEIKVSPFFDFNDPFEMKPRFDPDDINERIEPHLKRIDQYIKENITDYPENKEYIPRFYSDKIEELKSKRMQTITPDCEKAFEGFANQGMRVLCLSTVSDNLLMWAHYAKHHKGFVIEFDGTHNFFREKIRQNKPSFRFSRSVSYTKSDNNKRPICRISESEIKKNFEDCITNLFFIKSYHWEHEQEWRMIFPSNDKNIREGMTHDKKKYFLLKLPSDSIRAVIIGCRAWETENEQEPFADKLIKIIKERPQYSHIEIKKAVLDESEYKLNIVNWPNE